MCLEHQVTILQVRAIGYVCLFTNPLTFLVEVYGTSIVSCAKLKI